MAFTLKINSTSHEVDVDGDTPLLWVLRSGSRLPPSRGTRPEWQVSNADIVRQLEEESKKAGVVARNDGDPRPHRFRRMAPPLAGTSLIPHPPTEG